MSVSKDGLISKHEFYDYPHAAQSSYLSTGEAIEETLRCLKGQLEVNWSRMCNRAFLSGGGFTSAIVALAKKVEPDLDLLVSRSARGALFKWKVLLRISYVKRYRGTLGYRYNELRSILR